MKNYKKDRSYIIRKGIRDAVIQGLDSATEIREGEKRMSAKEAAIAFERQEIEVLAKDYACLKRTPKEWEEKINQDVIGQEKAVSQVVYVVYYNQMANLMEELGERHYKRINLLLMGPTGCGKTSIYNALKKYFSLPIAKYCADSITSAGYVGNKVEHILLRLLQEAGGDLHRAERGIIFIDEIDKKRTQSASDDGRDINGTAVQEEMLKILEPNVIDVTLPNKSVVQFDTSRLTVKLSGAFVGIEKIKRERLVKTTVGFKDAKSTMSEEEIAHSRYVANDFIKFGYIPEFIGRVQVIVELRKLDAKDILRIIFHGKNSPFLERSSFLSEVCNVEQQIRKKFMEQLAEELANSDTGARALEGRMEEMFEPIIQNALEHYGELGICIVDDDGEYELIYDDVIYYG